MLSDTVNITTTALDGQMKRYAFMLLLWIQNKVWLNQEYALQKCVKRDVGKATKAWKEYVLSSADRSNPARE